MQCEHGKYVLQGHKIHCIHVGPVKIDPINQLVCSNRIKTHIAEHFGSLSPWKRITTEWENWRFNETPHAQTFFIGSTDLTKIIWWCGEKNTGKEELKLAWLSQINAFSSGNASIRRFRKFCTRKIKCKTNCVQRSWRMKKRWRRSLKKIKLFHWNRSTE